jgi:hypothetical protein
MEPDFVTQNLALGIMLSLAVPTAALAMPRCSYAGISRDVSNFLGRDAACSIEPDIAPMLKLSKAEVHSRFRCDALGSDRTSLKQRYHDKPRVLEILDHRHCTLSVGLLGIERYPYSPQK